MNYEFHVGDYVETKDGAVGYVCQVTWDMIRWICTLGTPKWPVRGMYFAERSKDFSIDYKQIGQYDFTKPEVKQIEKLTYTESYINGYQVLTGRKLIDKINELVDAVNELKE